MWSQDYEEFSENQIKLLKKYVTNTSSHIFALRNLPEVIKGALFSRYSRSSLGLRSLLLKEFINNSGEEADFKAMVNTFATGLDESETDLQEEAIKKAERFYNRILDGYGDDSIGELGGSHLALENISMIAAKAIEDCRIGGSPLEKSTRYIYFDQKVNGEYLFYREPVLMTSAFKEMYIDTCNLLFDTYSRLIPPVTAIIEKKFPQDETSSKTAYAAALRAKVLDCLRGLLPAGTLTNVGISGNGRFFEQLINKLNFNNLSELQAIGSGIYQELTKVIPSFIRRAGTSHHNYQSYATFMEAMQSDILRVSSKHADKCPTVNINLNKPSVNLIYADEDSPVKVAAAILFQTSKASLANLQNYCQDISPEDINLILDAACNARENRRHKSPRALEHAQFTFEIVADYGTYRDLHRHRALTQEKQSLNCDYGYYIPPEIMNTPFEDEYREAMKTAKAAFDQISEELPEEAQYVVPMAYNIRWYFHINLRALQWLCELRSAAAGHPTYRLIAQEMAKQVIQKFPEFERFFKFVDFEGYELGRLGQEQRKFEKLAKIRGEKI